MTLLPPTKYAVPSFPALAGIEKCGEQGSHPVIAISLPDTRSGYLSIVVISHWFRANLKPILRDTLLYGIPHDDDPEAYHKIDLRIRWVHKGDLQEVKDEMSKLSDYTVEGDNLVALVQDGMSSPPHVIP